jgi:hypothetical protein
MVRERVVIGVVDARQAGDAQASELHAPAASEIQDTWRCPTTVAYLILAVSVLLARFRLVGVAAVWTSLIAVR